MFRRMKRNTARPNVSVVVTRGSVEIDLGGLVALFLGGNLGVLTLRRRARKLKS